MSIRSTMIAAAAVAAAFTSTFVAVAPAAAQTLSAVEVSYADLNLQSAAGRSVLDRRIGYAARQLCGVYLNTELELSQESANCQRQVIASAHAQRDAIIGGERFASLVVRRAAS